MKRIVQLAVFALACSAGAAWAQQGQEKSTQDSAQPVNVAQAGPGAETTPAALREEAPGAKMSFHEWTGLAGDGVFPSRGGPIDGD